MPGLHGSIGNERRLIPKIASDYVMIGDGIPDALFYAQVAILALGALNSGTSRYYVKTNRFLVFFYYTIVDFE